MPMSFVRGKAVTIAESTRPYYSQAIALACRIEREELILEPTYGVKDPTFSRINESELRYTIAQFWPEIQLTSIDPGKPTNSGNNVIVIDFVFGE